MNQSINQSTNRSIVKILRRTEFCSVFWLMPDINGLDPDNGRRYILHYESGWHLERTLQHSFRKKFSRDSSCEFIHFHSNNRS